VPLLFNTKNYNNSV